MMMCSACKENMAVVFVSKIVDGKQIQEGLCLKCAKKQNIQPINQLLEQSGMNDEDIDNLHKQMGSLFENMDFSPAVGQNDSQHGNLHDSNSNSGAFAGQENPIMSFLNKAFGKSDEMDMSGQDFQKSSFDDKDVRNTARTKTQERKINRKKKYLDTYGTNLVEEARENRLDRVVGREKEIERIIQILNRRTKNNPVLVGEPGVGKTAIAEGLAVKISEKQVPAKLMNYEVYLLDMTGIVAGTQFRGQFEGRMKGIIDEARQLGNIILVIDELHNIMGAGEAEGAMNAANILKPALARGEIQVIGATTLNEYRKHIEKDSALERRFQPVMVDEPNIEETIEILRGIKGYYEDYHKVMINEEVIRTAVELSERYITDRFLPDKAIDVIDEAGSRANLRNHILSDLEALRFELKKVQEEKEYAISADSIEDYQKAADLKTHECKLLGEIHDLEEKNKLIAITIEDIASVVEAWTKIPVQRITEIEAQKLLEMENRLHERVIGQHQAVSLVSKAIRRSRSGLKKRKKPASFIFVGPTGVGKTELVKALSSELFGSEESLIRMDMSEYMEKHTVSKLIGAPPGYIGYDEAGQLTEKVRRRPYSVILFDEIEKAHPDVFNMLLQIMDEGRLTDNKGRVVNFENTILIMTSNAGTGLKSAGIGFGTVDTAKETKIKEHLKEIFRPEFLNRVDEIVVFSELNQEELKQIVSLMLEEVADECRGESIIITFEPEVIDLVLEKGYDAKFGARPLRRTIQRMIEDELAEKFLKEEFKAGDRVHAVKDGDRIIFRRLADTLLPGSK